MPTSEPLVIGGVELPAGFYEPVGEHEFRSTIATESPWDPRAQHGGPPAALLARAVEHARPDESMRITRFTVDMLGAIPQGVMRTEAEVVRPGKRIELIEARLFVGDQLTVRASAWRIRVDEGLTVDHTTSVDVPSLFDEQPQDYFPGVSPTWGYGRAIEWRYAPGSFEALGEAEVWARPRIPLVAGEETSGVSRLMIVADSCNGVSLRLPAAQWLSIPPTLTVTVQQPSTQEWMLLRAETQIGPDGIGMARGRLLDESGLLAEIAQPLLVTPRG